MWGHARVSTGPQNVAAHDEEPRAPDPPRALRAAGPRQVFRETVNGAKTDRAPLRKAHDQLEADAYAPRAIIVHSRCDTEADQ